MSVDRLEQELKTFFRCEVEAATPPQDWWQAAVARATAGPPPGRPKTGLAAWARDLLDILHINPQRPFWGPATMLVVMIMFVVVSYGAGVVIQNFPGGMTGTPPVSTGVPPTVTGFPPPITITNTTMTIPQASANLNVIIFVLIFVFLSLTTFSLLLLKWRRNRKR